MFCFVVVFVIFRMESNGVKGRIHVSESTAEELRARGKGHWLTPREDKINVKGKGMMTTYFVNIVAESKMDSDSSAQSTASF